MANPIVDALVEIANGITKTMKSRTINAQDKLAREILKSQSAYIVGYFLDTVRRDDITFHYREAAIAAAARLINGTETDESDKNYLRVLIDDIAETDDDDLQEDAKEMIMSCADDKELSEIALNDDEDEDVRVRAVEIMTDIDLLLDIAADAENDDVRQAAKRRIKEQR